MKVEKEEQLLKKRLAELSRQAYHKGITKYTDFLNLNEISIFHSMEKEFFPVHTMLFGGYEDAERRMVGFYYGEQEEIESQFPVTCIKISPVSQKFSEELKHPDVLGAVLSLGIERCKTGDILIQGKEAFLFCDRTIAPFIIESLTKIRHTNVICSEEKETTAVAIYSFKEIIKSVSSCRLDAVISAALCLSRGKTAELIKAEKVFVNARLTTSISTLLKPEDVVSVRGHGKFCLKELNHLTKKGRTSMTLLLYT